MNERERLGIVDDYLNGLDRELRDLPRGARLELVQDVRGHIEEAWSSSETRDRATLLNIIERLGEPEVVAREGRERLGLPEPSRSGGPDLLAGAAVVLTAILWPIGIVLAWLSPQFRTRDKAIATLIPVIGFALAMLWLLPAGTSSSSESVSVVAVSSDSMGYEGETTPESSDASRVVAAEPAEVVGTETATEEDGRFIQLLGTLIAFWGLFGSGITAALYLAARMRPRSGVGAPLAAVLGVLAILLLCVVGLIGLNVAV